MKHVFFAASVAERETQNKYTVAQLKRQRVINASVPATTRPIALLNGKLQMKKRFLNPSHKQGTWVIIQMPNQTRHMQLLLAVALRDFQRIPLPPALISILRQIIVKVFITTALHCQTQGRQ
jgi:hypothetical protein